MPRTYLRMQDLTNRFHCKSRQTIYDWMKLEEHPLPPPRIRQRGVGNLWLESEIEAWEDGK